MYSASLNGVIPSGVLCQWGRLKLKTLGLTKNTQSSQGLRIVSFCQPRVGDKIKWIVHKGDTSQGFCRFLVQTILKLVADEF